MSGIEYYRILKDCKEGIFLREKLVLYAQAHGIKPAAVVFKTTVRTVRKWLRRYQENGVRGLSSRSRRPKHSPNRVHSNIPERIVAICDDMTARGKRLTATYVFNEETFHCSMATIRRIMHKNGYGKKQRSRVKKRVLTASKEQLKPLERIQIDVKYLDDIPEMFSDLITHRLPLYQFTARDVRTGTLFVCYAREKTVHNAVIFLHQLVEHFSRHGLDVQNTIIQTDNGVEFIQNMHTRSFSLFTHYAEQHFLIHRTIPVGAKTWQSDVETSHRLIEDEFYAVRSFPSCKSFLKQAASYTDWFNCGRFNRNKKGTPLSIWRLYDETITTDLFRFEPVILDNFFDKYFDCA